jgi:hypothetical protein
MGLFDEWDVPIILEHHCLIDGAETDAIYERMATTNSEGILSDYVKRAYFDYRCARDFLH